MSYDSFPASNITQMTEQSCIDLSYLEHIIDCPKKNKFSGLTSIS